MQLEIWTEPSDPRAPSALDVIAPPLPGVDDLPGAPNEMSFKGFHLLQVEALGLATPKSSDIAVPVRPPALFVRTLLVASQGLRDFGIQNALRDAMPLCSFKYKSKI